jgi:hypothetical protein
MLRYWYTLKGWLEWPMCWVRGHDMHTFPASCADGAGYIYCTRCNKLEEV